MKITLDLVAGLPKKELVERIHYHRRQGDIAERALGFYLLDMDRRKMYRPLESASEWARKHLPEQQRPDKLILLARRLEKLPTIRAAFDSGEVPWTKIRDCAFPPRSPQGEVCEDRQARARTGVARPRPKADLPGA